MLNSSLTGATIKSAYVCVLVATRNLTILINTKTKEVKMNFLQKKVAVLVILIAMTNFTYAQGTKIKAIMIVNGDTTTNEEILDEKLAMENDDSVSAKKIIKKIIIDDEKIMTDDVFAYAYNIGENDGNSEIEIVTNEKDEETKVIIKNHKKNGSVEEKSEKNRAYSVSKNIENSRENLKIKINVEEMQVKFDIETNSTEPLNVSILNEDGKQVFYDSQKNGNKYNKEIKLEKKGTYFLNLIQNKKSTTEKIVIP